MIQRIEKEGRIEYKLNDMLHRTNGPATEYKHTNDWGWYLFGNRHRYYGPRTNFRADAWYLHGEYIK